jgi:hypothetical protein
MAGAREKAVTALSRGVSMKAGFPCEISQRQIGGELTVPIVKHRTLPGIGDPGYGTRRERFVMVSNIISREGCVRWVPIDLAIVVSEPNGAIAV